MSQPVIDREIVAEGAPHADAAALARLPARRVLADARPSLPVPAPRTEHPETEYSQPVGGWIKRAFDICAAVAILTLLSPVLLLIGALVRLDSAGPALFRQDRGGFNGEAFRIFKFRTMRVMENGAAIQQAQRQDNRITKLGAFLRRTSLDELPQLLNVVLGDMSLVGPRPHALAHDSAFTQTDWTYPQRQKARPGITGLAQISGCRGLTETAEAVRDRTAFDNAYVRAQSFWLDVWILLKTARVVFGDENAH